MFTGIIKHTGKLSAQAKGPLTFEVGLLAKKLKIGSSIAVNGACLTVTAKMGKSFTADVMPETLKKTNLGSRKPGDFVNLELPLPATGCFEGHIVTGHVEGAAKVTAIKSIRNAREITVALPKELCRYVVPKGSIALNGVSLTAISVKKNRVTVGIIPYTWRHTNFHTLRVGDTVNVETDIIGKYLEKRFTESR